jgi:hypothetical protein
MSVISDSIFDLAPPATIVENLDGSGSINIHPIVLDPNLTKIPSLIPAYPPVFLAPLGAIILQWGAFEALHGDILNALMAFNNTSGERISSGFERRRKRFKVEARKAFFGLDSIIAHVIHLNGDAKTIYPDRNALAHGELISCCKWDFPAENRGADGLQFSIVAKHEQRGQEVEKSFTMIQLRTLFYDIIHLGGRLNELTQENPDILGISFREKQKLREFQDAVLPRLPIANMPVPPPKL